MIPVLFIRELPKKFKKQAPWLIPTGLFYFRDYNLMILSPNEEDKNYLNELAS